MANMSIMAAGSYSCGVRGTAQCGAARLKAMAAVSIETRRWLSSASSMG